jgi:hypothetical protein
MTLSSKYRNRHENVLSLKKLLGPGIVRQSLGAEFSPYDVIHPLPS